uniref:Cytochrome P450 n=1 Tax=Thermosporothrix sp. COM3 TaxID=2490863 RepID=A0A455SL00_9CHLR|nr:hypothetical protein KTC_23330 [Thermosporothrix sp. COM3]
MLQNTQSQFLEELLTPFPGFIITRVQPAFYEENAQMWHVFSYASVQHVITNSAIFSCDRNRLYPTMPDPDDPTYQSMLHVDPPKHTRLRSLVSHVFTPRRVAQMEQRIRAMVQTLLDQLEAKDHVDAIDDLAHPLPTLVIAELLGIPQPDRDRFRVWTDAYVEFITPLHSRLHVI